MTCGAALLFDSQTDAAIRAAWKTIAGNGATAAAPPPSRMLALDYPPHLSLLICEKLDLPGTRAALLDWLAAQPPLVVDFPALGIFPGDEGVIYLAPTVSRALLDFHAGLWALLAPYIQGPAPLYRPGVWVPHVTLDLELTPTQAAAAIEALNRAGCLPPRGTLATLLVADFTPASGRDVAAPASDEGLNPRATDLFTARLGGQQ